MKTLFTLLALHFSLLALKAQTISTYAGGGSNGLGDGGPATAGTLYNPIGIAIDPSGNLYIADYLNNLIRKVNSLGIISTYAGNNHLGQGYTGDGGPATSARIDWPWGITLDSSGNLYFADEGNDVVRRVNTSDTINTFAGNNSYHGYSGDGGPATAAHMYDPYDVLVDDSGNLYIADIFNNVVRRVNTLGIISTIAGNYAFGAGYSGDGGQATVAELYRPNFMTFDAYGNLCISAGYVIRQVNDSGIISTIVGNGHGGYSGDGGPAASAELNEPSGLAYDTSGNLYIGDNNNYVIRMVNTAGIISTVVGNNVKGYSGDRGPATAAEINQPGAIVFDASGNLYIADELNNVIRKVTWLTTGKNELRDKSEEIRVYPNPTNQSLILNFNGQISKGCAAVSIMDITSKEMFNCKCLIVNGHLCIDVSSLTTGIYFLDVIINNHNFIQKFIKN